MSFTVPNAVLPPNSLILVTGANGFIASHCVDQALAAGYRVRGTVRKLEKGEWLQEYFDAKYGKGKLELVVVEDMGTDGAFDEAVKGVAGILHVATSVNPTTDPNESIPPVVNGTVGIAKSAAKSPSVKRLVLTSSSTAATNPTPNKKFDITVDSWNEQSIKDAWAPPPYTEERGWAIYSASKTQGEQALWKWVEEHKPGFVVNTVLPNANFGTILSPKNQGLPSTAFWAGSFFKGENIDKLKGIPPQYFVNVQDTARLHIIAVAHPDVKNERVFAFTEPFNWNDLLAAYRGLFPDRKFVDDIPDLEHDLSVVVPKARAEQLLKEIGRPGFTGLKESLEENVQSLL